MWARRPHAKPQSLREELCSATAEAGEQRQGGQGRQGGSIAARRAVSGSKGGKGREVARPERALRNLLERDALFTEGLRDETTRLELAAIQVDVATSEDALVRRVAAVFGL